MAHTLLSQEKLDVVLRLQAAVENWLHLEGNARSTLAGAVVLLDTIRSKAPFAETDVFTGGGQLAGGRGAALRMTLQRYGIQNPDLVKDEHAAFAGDVQTGRVGDIVVGDLVFHVTAAPATPVIEKCVRNLQAGKHPVLAVPRQSVERARTIAETVAPAWHRRITFVAIEDFVAANILELAHGDSSQFFNVLEQILRRYNEVVASYETDASLRIEVE